jgi:hypothetical protein
MLFQVIRERKELHAQTQKESKTLTAGEDATLGFLITVIYINC